MVAEKKAVNFTEGKLFFKIVWFVLPIVATNLLQTLYNAADMMVVSLSKESNAVGAIGMTGSFIALILNVFIGFSIGANVVVARGIGAGNKEKTQNAVHTSLIMALIFGTIGMLVGFLVSRPVLQWMGAEGNLLDLAVKYTYFYFAGVPFLALTNYLIAIFRAKGDSKTPLIVLALAGLLNVVLNLMFVLVVGMSVEGVALATAIANVVSFAVLLIKLRKDDDFTKFSFRKLKISVKEMKEIVTVGVPAAIQGALFAFSNVLIQSSIVAVNNRLCPVGSEYQPIVNGSAAAGNLMGFVYTAMNAVYQGAITFTSQNMGANKPERVKPIMYNCFVITSIIGLSFGLSVFFLRAPLLSLYGIVDGAEGSMEALAMYAATTRLLYECVPYFLCGIMETCTGVLRGLGRSALSTVISLIGACLLRVVWLWTVFPLFMTIESISISYSITWLLTASISFTFIQIIVRDLVKRKRISN